MPYCSIEEAWGKDFFENDAEPEKFKKIVSDDYNNNEDYFNRISFTFNFMKTNKKITQSDLAAWNYNLERKCLKYVNLCLKTKTNISWSSVYSIFLLTKNFIFLLKIIWRILKDFFKYS